MAQWIVDNPAHPRRALFLRTQAPFILVVLTLMGLGFGLGLSSDRDVYTGTGVGLIAFATTLSILVPWEGLPWSASAITPVLNLLGVVALAVSFQERLSTVPALAIFPAIWLAMDHDLRGAIVGILGAFAASVAPILLSAPAPTADEWIEALVVPVLISAAAAASSVMANRTAQAREVLLTVASERDTAAAENARLGGALQSFARQVDVGIVFFDQNAAIVMSNEAARDFGELAAFDGEGESARHAYGQDQITPLDPGDQPLNRVLAGDVVHDLLLWVGPRGAQKALLANGAPVFAANGSSAGSFLVLQDVTTVTRASRDRESALATLTHELRTPLTAIIGYLDLMELDDRPEEAEKVAIAIRNADHMLALTTAFLADLRHPHALDVQPNRVAALVMEAITDAAALPGYAQRRLEVSIDEVEDMEVEMDADAIRQVLDNLLSNAVKFSPVSGLVRVSARRDANSVTVAVENEGAVLTKDEIERIFDRFYRGSNAQEQAIPGTGLGLSISRGIVRRHGGSLTATQADGMTRLNLQLPAPTTDRN